MMVALSTVSAVVAVAMIVLAVEYDVLVAYLHMCASILTDALHPNCW
jgi:hypothetical protein